MKSHSGNLLKLKLKMKTSKKIKWNNCEGAGLYSCLNVFETLNL